jgi:hypothetical protein
MKRFWLIHLVLIPLNAINGNLINGTRYKAKSDGFLPHHLLKKLHASRIIDCYGINVFLAAVALQIFWQ